MDENVCRAYILVICKNHRIKSLWDNNLQGKTWLTAVFCCVRAILYPGTKIVIASGTLKQAREVIEKIDDLIKECPNLKREVSYISTGQNDARVEFHGGSWIKTVTSSDGARGKRANILIIDEFRMAPLEVINKVLRKFLSDERRPGYLKKKEYKHLREPNKELYLSSCYYKHHWSWDKIKAYFNAMTDGKKYFLCSLPYYLPVKEGLLNPDKLRNDMTEDDFDPIAFLMEMESLYYGESDKSYFKIKEMQDCRTIGTAIYPIEVKKGKKNKTSIQKRDNELRILGVDVALMSGKDNDNTIITFMRLIPDSNEYTRQVLHIESVNGENTFEQALRVKRLFYDLECDYCAIDASGNGLGVFDILTKFTTDNERGSEYPAWTTIDQDDKMSIRSTDENAVPVIFPIKATSEINHKIAIALRSAFQKMKIRLLVSEIEAKEYLIKIDGFLKKSVEEQTDMIAPHIQTSLLINEIVNLEGDTSSGYIKIKEVGRARKDRYSSIAYANYFANILEEKFLSQEEEENILDYLFV